MKKAETLNKLLLDVNELNVAVVEYEGKKEKILPAINKEIKELKKDYSFLEIKAIINDKIDNLKPTTLKNVDLIIDFNKYNLDFEKFYIKDLENVLKMIKAICRKDKIKGDKFISFLNSSELSKKEAFGAVQDALKMVKKADKKDDKKDDKKADKKADKKDDITDAEIVNGSLLIEDKKDATASINEIKVIKEKLKKGQILSKKEREILIQILETLA
jgi:hypothetical protein